MLNDGEKYAKDAAISMQRAELIVLKGRLGKISDRELEREKGGSGLRYSFDIRAVNGLYEVGVDAKAGAVLENGKEGDHPD